MVDKGDSVQKYMYWVLNFISKHVIFDGCIYTCTCMYLESRCLYPDCWSLPVVEWCHLWLIWTTPPAAVVFCYKYYQ